MSLFVDLVISTDPSDCANHAIPSHSASLWLVATSVLAAREVQASLCPRSAAEGDEELRADEEAGEEAIQVGDLQRVSPPLHVHGMVPKLLASCSSGPCRIRPWPAAGT